MSFSPNVVLVEINDMSFSLCTLRHVLFSGMLFDNKQTTSLGSNVFVYQMACHLPVNKLPQTKRRPFLYDVNIT